MRNFNHYDFIILIKLIKNMRTIIISILEFHKNFQPSLSEFDNFNSINKNN